MTDMTLETDAHQIRTGLALTKEGRDMWRKGVRMMAHSLFDARQIHTGDQPSVRGARPPVSGSPLSRLRIARR